MSRRAVGDTLPRRFYYSLERPPPDFPNLRRADATRPARRPHADRTSTASLARPGQEPQEIQALRQDQRTQELSLPIGADNDNATDDGALVSSPPSARHAAQRKPEVRPGAPRKQEAPRRARRGIPSLRQAHRPAPPRGGGVPKHGRRFRVGRGSRRQSIRRRRREHAARRRSRYPKGALRRPANAHGGDASARARKTSPALGNPGSGRPEYHERKSRTGHSHMSMAELVETTRRLLKAKIEIPTQYRGDKTEVLNWRRARRRDGEVRRRRAVGRRRRWTRRNAG